MQWRWSRALEQLGITTYGNWRERVWETRERKATSKNKSLEQKRNDSAFVSISAFFPLFLLLLTFKLEDQVQVEAHWNVNKREEEENPQTISFLFLSFLCSFFCFSPFWLLLATKWWQNEVLREKKRGGVMEGGKEISSSRETISRTIFFFFSDLYAVYSIYLSPVFTTTSSAAVCSGW